MVICRAREHFNLIGCFIPTPSSINNILTVLWNIFAPVVYPVLAFFRCELMTLKVWALKLRSSCAQGNFRGSRRIWLPWLQAVGHLYSCDSRLLPICCMMLSCHTALACDWESDPDSIISFSLESPPSPPKWMLIRVRNPTTAVPSEDSYNFNTFEILSLLNISFLPSHYFLITPPIFFWILFSLSQMAWFWVCCFLCSWL